MNMHTTHTPTEDDEQYHSPATEEYWDRGVRRLTRIAATQPAMPPRPKVDLGDYFVTRGGVNCHGIVCKAYDAPYPDGREITSIEPGTYLGPVESWLHMERCATICVRGWWIHVWARRHSGESYQGTTCATKVPEDMANRWRRVGWQD